MGTVTINVNVDVDLAEIDTDDLIEELDYRKLQPRDKQYLKAILKDEIDPVSLYTYTEQEKYNYFIKHFDDFTIEQLQSCKKI